jgi:heme iron utilization protein
VQDTEQTKQHLQELLASQKLAVLSTYDQGQAYASLVGFVATEDLKFLLFATDRRTRKYRNVMHNTRVALLFDNRSDLDTDFQGTTAVTVTGVAAEVPSSEREKWLPLYLEKHPHLAEFVNTSSCVLIRVNVEWYYIVNHFQHVVALPMI